MPEAQNIAPAAFYSRQEKYITFLTTPSGIVSVNSNSFLPSFIFARSNPLIFFKSSDKITKIIKTVPVCDLGYGIIGCGKLVTGLFNTLSVQIIHRCLMGHF